MLFFTVSSILILVVFPNFPVCEGQNARPASSMTPPRGMVCSPQNHITLNAPGCSENQTMFEVVDTLNRVEVTTSVLQRSIADISQSLEDNKKDRDMHKRDCYDILQAGHSTSGSYSIQPDDDMTDFRVYCDMETDSGGWTVFQRRSDGSMDFYRNWDAYKNGFGIVNAEFWLGNDKLFRLTNQRNYQLRVDMQDMDGNTAFALYGYFRVGDEFSKYKLVVGEYSGSSGDSFSGHSDHNFSTFDRDNDGHQTSNCASRYKGAWWYSECHSSNLNGQYLKGEHTSAADGVNWSAWKGYYYSLKSTEMKIRPMS
ncbi:techylectin-5A-like [Ptychodera flava]|uniref:techylectin-5A-like n=1 Tax=Ptychodera flava TaxID=63121 RepID=UPI003969D9B7